MTVSDYPDWQTPAAHASQIAVTGVPLLRASNNLHNNTAGTLAGGASMDLLGDTAVNQVGYEVTIEAWMAAGTGTVPFIQIEVYWWDSVSTLFAYRRDVVVPCGNAVGNILRSFLFGPMHSNMFHVIAKNLDPSVTANLKWTINQTSHLFARDEARQWAYAGTAPNGFSNPDGAPSSNLIAHKVASLASGTSTTVLCSLFAGDVVLNVDNSVGGQACTVQLLDPTGLMAGGVNNQLFKASVPANGILEQPLALPYAPVTVKLSNNATTGTITPTMTLTGQEH